jgi:sugar phosphate isomerase/epimerase
MTRRTLLGSAAAVPFLRAADQPHKAWKPRLGILCKYTPNNAQFAKTQGFSNLILDGGKGSTLSADKISDAEIDAAKRQVSDLGLTVSALQITVNHTDPDPERRARTNEYFGHAIAMASKLGVRYIGSASGKNPTLSFERQVDEIVRVYTEKYFPLCEKHGVRILWEPWPDGPNLATSPVGYDALFKAFGNSPYIGLQYDPSHLVRQFMDPIQTARDYVDKIYDVHLKDTEILWPVLRAGGIRPVNNASWWRYRIPGMGSINWREFFSVLQNVGYDGAMSVEQEDPLYGGEDNPGPDFSEDFKLGFIMAKRYLNQYVP